MVFKDFEKIYNIGKYWLEKCNDELMDDGSVYHHLPLRDISQDPVDISNLAIGDSEKRQFRKDMKAIEKYVKQVEAADKKAIVLNYEIMDMRQILPPWIVYPHYPANSVYLTGYFTIFKNFTAHMTNMEISVYKNLYPVPKYIEQLFTYKEQD